MTVALRSYTVYEILLLIWVLGAGSVASVTKFRKCDITEDQESSGI